MTFADSDQPIAWRGNPLRVTSALADLPLHDSAASRRLETAAASGLDAGELMARAGRAVARLALAVAPQARSIWVACGPGNNGGDGLVAATHLHALGRRVHVQLIADAHKLPEDARRALAQAQAAGVQIHEGPPPHCDLAIDALLGLGVSRPPAGRLAAAIDGLNGAAAGVLAIDLPSALSGDTGCVAGTQAVRACWTLSLLSLKPGLFTAQGRDHAGEIWFDAIGVEANLVPASSTLIGAQASLRAPPPRRHAQHKGSFGDVLVVGGAAGMQGAARLAARAALAAGAGRVYLSLLDDAASAADPARPELMDRDKAWQASPEWLARCTVVCGCGGGDAVRVALPALLHHAGRLVLDADALNAIAADANLHTLLRARNARGLHTLMTPHPLEAARLNGCVSEAIQADRLAAARALAAATGAVVVLKGSGTVIASPQGMALINPTGDAHLATAGTGDVLAGWLGGVWAQMPPAGNTMDVAAAGAWVHGATASLVPNAPWPVRAADLIDAMRKAASRVAMDAR